jgi:hypothetical protein
VTQAEPIIGWKRIALRSLFAGIGIAVTLSAIAGVLLLRSSRPQPALQWNTKAIIADGPPSFSRTMWVSPNDPKSTAPLLVLTYTLKNATGSDYSLTSTTDIQYMFRSGDGALGPNLLGAAFTSDVGNANSVGLPLFIPANQRAMIRCKIAFSDLPPQASSEPDADYHERLRAFLEKTYDDFGGLVIFDQTTRYEIDLPRWASEKQPKTRP